MKSRTINLAEGKKHIYYEVCLARPLRKRDKIYHGNGTSELIVSIVKNNLGRGFNKIIAARKAGEQTITQRTYYNSGNLLIPHEESWDPLLPTSPKYESLEKMLRRAGLWKRKNL